MMRTSQSQQLRAPPTLRALGALPVRPCLCPTKTISYRELSRLKTASGQNNGASSSPELLSQQLEELKRIVMAQQSTIDELKRANGMGGNGRASSPSSAPHESQGAQGWNASVSPFDAQVFVQGLLALHVPHAGCSSTMHMQQGRKRTSRHAVWQALP